MREREGEQGVPQGKGGGSKESVRVLGVSESERGGDTDQAD